MPPLMSGGGVCEMESPCGLEGKRLGEREHGEREGGAYVTCLHVLVLFSDLSEYGGQRISLAPCSCYCYCPPFILL